MNALRDYWNARAPREQWLACAVALLVPALAWLAFAHEPLALRVQQLDSAQRSAEARRLEARSALAELQARAAVDPDRAVRQALQAAQALREHQLASLDRETAALIDPQRMQQVLRDLLQQRPQLRLLALESFSAALELPTPPGEDQPAAGAAPASAAPLLHRHGMRLTLEGSYFELRDYLQGIERQSLAADGRRLFWERLDYQVGEDGPSRARIVIELYTLSREAGWIGV